MPYNQCLQGEQACNRAAYSAKASCQANTHYWKAYDLVEKASRQGLVKSQAQCSDANQMSAVFAQMNVDKGNELATFLGSACGCYICDTLFP